MQDVLAPIANIPGVTGAAAFAADDRCLASTLQPPYEEILIEQVMRIVRQALVTLNIGFESEATWNALFLRCDGGHLVVKRVDDRALVVFGQPSMNVAMVNVGLNVAAMKLRNVGAAPVAIAPAPTTPTRAVAVAASGVSQGSLTPTGDGIPMSIGSGPVPSSGGPSMNWSSSAHPGPAGVLTRTTIELVLRVLAKHLGPIAKTIMRDELVALGLAANAVPFSSYSDLLDQMARHVQDPQHRTAFLVEAELIGLHTPLR